MFRAVRSWFVRAAGVLGRRHGDQELAEEIESHLALHAADHERSGLSPA